MEPTQHNLASLRQRTLWGTLCDAATRSPQHVALVGASDAGEIRRLTYEALRDRASAVASGLVRIGVRRGDRVVLWMTNKPEWVVTMFAATQIGAAVVPVNTFLKPDEVQYVVRQSGARHLIMLDRFRALDFPGMLTQAAPELRDARPGHCSSSIFPDLRNVVVFDRGGRTPSFAYAFGDLEANSAPSADLRAAMTRDVGGSDLAMVKYTSGSTGFPKGVMLEHGGIVANAVLHSSRIGIDGSDVFFSMMPFFHAGGSIWGLMTMIANGGTLVFTEAFDAELGAQLIEQERCTVIFGVVQDEVYQVALDGGRDFSSVRIAAADSEVGKKMLPGVERSIRPFGLTECYGPAAVTGFADPIDKQQTTCGRPLDGYELRVVDPDSGRDVNPGEVGEAWLRANVMAGYWEKPDETARAIDSEGWLHSEDLIRLDGDGYIEYVGRRKLMLKVGGENVSIEEVERIVESHEAIAECGVIGVPDERKGEVVRALVVLGPGKTIAADELHQWLATRLARFKQPREIVIVADLPHLANGKLDRLALAEHDTTPAVPVPAD